LSGPTAIEIKNLNPPSYSYAFGYLQLRINSATSKTLPCRRRILSAWFQSDNFNDAEVSERNMSVS